MQTSSNIITRKAVCFSATVAQSKYQSINVDAVKVDSLPEPEKTYYSGDEPRAKEPISIRHGSTELCVSVEVAHALAKVLSEAAEAAV